MADEEAMPKYLRIAGAACFQSQKAWRIASSPSLPRATIALSCWRAMLISFAVARRSVTNQMHRHQAAQGWRVRGWEWQ